MTTKIEYGTTIGNVSVLDLRSATEESVSRIRTIGNVATILTSPETTHLTARLHAGNVANTVEIKGETLIISGNQTLTRDAFKNIPEPLSVLVAGNVTISPEIIPEELEAGLRSITITGNVICPDHLAGIINSRAGQIAGNLIIVPGDAKLIQGKLQLTESFLNSLGDGANVVVMGHLMATDLLSNDLIAQKLDSLHIHGRAYLHQENAATIMASLDSMKTNIAIIPEGYTYVEQDVALNETMLSTLTGSKLYCQSIRIDDNIDSDMLERHLDSLIVKNILICPAKLQTVISQKCNLLETQAIFYSGELWLVDDDSRLLPQRFSYIEDTATLIVRGELSLAEDIDPSLLASRLDKVHNFGIINCTTDQMAALQSRLGTNNGLFEDTTERVEVSNQEHGRVIGNIAYLKL